MHFLTRHLLFFFNLIIPSGASPNPPGAEMLFGDGNNMWFGDGTDMQYGG